MAVMHISLDDEESHRNAMVLLGRDAAVAADNAPRSWQNLVTASRFPAHCRRFYQS